MQRFRSLTFFFLRHIEWNHSTKASFKVVEASLEPESHTLRKWGSSPAQWISLLNPCFSLFFLNILMRDTNGGEKIERSRGREGGRRGRREKESNAPTGVLLKSGLLWWCWVLNLALERAPGIKVFCITIMLYPQPMNPCFSKSKMFLSYQKQNANSGYLY